MYYDLGLQIHPSFIENSDRAFVFCSLCFWSDVEIPPFIYIPQVSALFFNITVNCTFWFPEFFKFSTVKVYYFNKKMHTHTHRVILRQEAQEGLEHLTWHLPPSCWRFLLGQLSQ